MADYTLQQRFLKASSFKMRSTTSMMATRGLLWIIPSSRPAMFLFSLYSFAEHIDFTNFVTHFGLTNRESATKSFEDLLQSTRIPSKRREFINAEFNKFRMQYEDQICSKTQLRADCAGTRMCGTGFSGEIEISIWFCGYLC
ncbi:hypothetical protein BGZ58_002297 [Dissophora ornata]|nr:hypothetical protein BGZ58_002297 [Dissophora ornata]